MRCSWIHNSNIAFVAAGYRLCFEAGEAEEIVEFSHLQLFHHFPGYIAVFVGRDEGSGEQIDEFAADRLQALSEGAGHGWR
ncbi:MAG: hypothetical protein VKO39_13330 [Cyanobacteriota bacterium]|nr:hypothetical protein [Cyanobacteriota bacterium]